ncbi:50S ribosomal protein L6 [Planctomycetales bacterium ZRK34]|nr:50S ribosomal protein L6 [Planctomycetales bacterium ZRK34]
MSRIGNKPIDLPAGVNVSVSGRTVTVQGKDKTLTYEHRPEVSVKVEDKQVVVERANDQKQTKAYHGLTRALVNNMIIGVSEGFKKELEINGVGWTARVQGRKLALNVGYADTRELDIPMGVEVAVQGNKIAITGAEKQAVGQFAAATRAQRPPEPYNGKGIKYSDEVIVRKEGKAFAGGGA